MLALPAMTRKRRHPICQLVVIGYDAASIAISAEVFAWIKGERGNVAESTDELPFVFGQMSLRTIFDHPEIMLLRDRHDRVHVCGLAVEMNWNKTDRRRRNLRLD